MSTDAMKLALEQTLEMLSDNREYIEANERSEYLAMYDKAIAGAEKALAEQPAPAAQRKPLTDEQLRSMCKQTWVFETVKQWARVIEAAHGIKEKS